MKLLYKLLVFIYNGRCNDPKKKVEKKRSQKCFSYKKLQDTKKPWISLFWSSVQPNLITFFFKKILHSQKLNCFKWCFFSQKCCFNGCGRSCMDPVRDPGEQLPSEVDENGNKIDPFDPNAPQIRVSLSFFKEFDRKFDRIWSKNGNLWTKVGYILIKIAPVIAYNWNYSRTRLQRTPWAWTHLFVITRVRYIQEIHVPVK